ncbi:MAG: hypothetical protein ACREMN_09685 [Gemmatimonadales bacterium]
MTALSALWLPILLSAVLVFVVSSAIHMLPLWHKNDYPKMEQEAQVMDALRPLGIRPGDYMMPRAASMAEVKSVTFQERRRRGPAMIVTVLPPGPTAMGKSLTLWFLYSVVISLFAAYVAGRALPPGAEYLTVFRFAGVTAFLGYAAALWQMSIWYARSLRMTVLSTIDGLIYALATAGVFGWLWPGI